MSACVDASLILKCLTYELDSDAAIAWLHAHKDEDMFAPSLILAEVASVLRQKVSRNEITFSEGQEALLVLEMLGIRLVSDLPLLRRAFELAAELDQPSVYDTLYLAAAERERCDLWTADARSARAASARYPVVRLVGSPDT